MLFEEDRTHHMRDLIKFIPINIYIEEAKTILCCLRLARHIKSTVINCFWRVETMILILGIDICKDRLGNYFLEGIWQPNTVLIGQKLHNYSQSFVCKSGLN